MTTPPENAGRARYTYRLRLSSTAERALLEEWDRCRWVWNQCVAESKAAFAASQPCGPTGLCKKLTAWRAEHPWLRAGAQIPQQQTVRAFGEARAKALKDLKNRVPLGRRAGLPKFKKKDDAPPSLNYTARNFSLVDGRLRVAGGIPVTVVWSRELPSVPSSVRIYRDNLGHWYASFVVLVAGDPLPTAGAVIGIDWGVKEIATTTSDAHDLAHPRFARASAEKLGRYHRMMSRRRPAKDQPTSKGYKQAKRLAAKTRKKIARQRQDAGRKWAKKVATDHDVIAVEDFKPKFLAKSTMAGKVADAAIGATKTALLEMARKHGRTVHLVDPAYTTMDCGGCGARAKHALPLSERTYTCTACGLSSPRDKNSARVMLVRAGLNPDGAEGVRQPRALLKVAA